MHRPSRRLRGALVAILILFAVWVPNRRDRAPRRAPGPAEGVSVER